MPDDIEQNYWENQTKKDLITIKPLIKVITRVSTGWE
jgi:hypothetical protein